MFNEYLYEIMAALGITVSLLALVLLKKRNQKTQSLPPLEEIHTEDSQEETTQEEELDTIIETRESVIEDAYDTLGGTEEGDFGERIEEENIQKSSETTEFRKRVVVEHGKITKENFKEFSGERILIAEDNLINQKVLLGLLGESGMDLVIANDGQEALDILAKDSDFLMVLMDAHMPRVDGFEATRQIRKNPDYNHILVVALSGDTAADDIAKMRNAGMAEQLEKPLRMDALYDILYAYTGISEDKNEDSDDEYIDVIMTKELNGDKGLSICGGDENFYHEILDEFVKTYSDSDHKLHTLLTSDKIQQADKLLLDILGVSANIGAENLNITAQKIKDSLNDQHNKSYLTLLDNYTKDLKALLLDIKEYI